MYAALFFLSCTPARERNALMHSGWFLSVEVCFVEDAFTLGIPAFGDHLEKAKMPYNFDGAL